MLIKKFCSTCLCYVTEKSLLQMNEECIICKDSVSSDIEKW